MARFSKRKEKAYRKQHYSSNREKALQKINYKCNADVRKRSDRDSYQDRSAPKKRIMRRYNALNTGKLKSVINERCIFLKPCTKKGICEAEVCL